MPDEHTKQNKLPTKEKNINFKPVVHIQAKNHQTNWDSKL
jgi:hypothetical protein